jgi:hypothetical protein
LPQHIGSGSFEAMQKRILARLCVFLAVAVAADGAFAVNWFSRGHGRAPDADRVYVCHGYTCQRVTPVRLSAGDIAEIAGDLRNGTANAEAERHAVSRAVQTFERIVGARIGTGNDLPGMQFGQGSPGQMDCIDEATNTTSLLVFLAMHGYLRHHDVEEPASRGFFLDGRYPHATAVLAEKGGGPEWAIDSWPRANAEPPVIQPLPEWRRSRSGAET